MKVEKRIPPPVQPDPVIDITGLSLEQALALKDLAGRFSCDDWHWHTTLYYALESAVKRAPGGCKQAGVRNNLFKFTESNTIICVSGESCDQPKA